MDAGAVAAPASKRTYNCLRCLSKSLRYKLVFYPFDLAYRQKLNVSHVVEWASVNFHEPRGKIVFGVLLALLLLALMGRRRWKLAEVGMVAFGLYMSLTYVRFLFPAAILIAPVLARQMDFMPAYYRKAD